MVMTSVNSRAALICLGAAWMDGITRRDSFYFSHALNII